MQRHVADLKKRAAAERKAEQSGHTAKDADERENESDFAQNFSEPRERLDNFQRFLCVLSLIKIQRRDSAAECADPHQRRLEPQLGEGEKTAGEKH